MTYRFYPRNKQSRTDSLIGPDHVFRLAPRENRSRRDGLAKSIGPGDGPLVMSVAPTLGNSIGVKSIVAGGSNLLFTCSGQDLWSDVVGNTAIRSAVIGGLATGFNVTSLQGILQSSGSAPFSVDVTSTKLNIKLPAIAAYSPGASTAFDWTFPEQAFRNRAGSFLCASCIVVTSAA